MPRKQTPITDKEAERIAYISSRIEGYPAKVDPMAEARIAKLLKSIK